MIYKDFNVERLSELSVEGRNKVIKDIYHNKNISIRQLGRVLGIGKTIIDRAIRQYKTIRRTKRPHCFPLLQQLCLFKIL